MAGGRDAEQRDLGRDADPRWADSEARLVERIRDEILASPDGRITFARFMARALAEPGLGYYASSDRRPTREGDFLTAPELHPLFGRCLGRFLDAAWAAAGRPPVFRVHEYGAGRGTLRETVLDSVEAPLEWSSIDLPHRSDPVVGQPDVVLANEFLDALPVHRLVQAGSLLEAWVGWREGWFAEVLAQPSTPDLAAHFDAAGVVLREGQRAEVCLAGPRWLGAVAENLGEGGLVLVIDYGHEAEELYGPRRMAGSLLTYRAHKVGDDPFEAVGATDITAHIDVTALRRAARDAGLVLMGEASQARFLAELGLGEELAALGRRPDADVAGYLEARAAVARLLDPRHLGSYRVLAWGRPSATGSGPTDLPGFGAAA